jgi:membrane protease subunit HflK
MAGNNGGPWGGGGGNRGDGDDDRRPPGRRPGGEGPQIPEIDELMNKGREQLRVLMGGGRGNGPAGGSGLPQGPKITRGTVGIAALAAVGLWAFMSFYTVRPEEQSVELFLGSFSSIGNPGLNFAPWPVVTYDVVNVTSERTESIGSTAGAPVGDGLMLTTDSNIVDIGFQVVWNVNDPSKLIFNLADPELTVRSISESVMREIIAATNLAPILNRDRGAIADRARADIQASLDTLDSGINVLRVNLEKADPPVEVIDSFRAVQAAAQERDRLQRQADAYANTVLADARGRAAQILELAEGYRAQTVNDALGQASRFTAVLGEYQNAEEVTRRRIYLETMERVLGDMGKIVLDPAVAGSEGGGSGVVPFLPLNEIMRTAPGAAAADAAGN